MKKFEVIIATNVPLYKCVEVKAKTGEAAQAIVQNQINTDKFTEEEIGEAIDECSVHSDLAGKGYERHNVEAARLILQDLAKHGEGSLIAIWARSVAGGPGPVSSVVSAKPGECSSGLKELYTLNGGRRGQ